MEEPCAHGLKFQPWVACWSSKALYALRFFPCRCGPGHVPHPDRPAAADHAAPAVSHSMDQPAVGWSCRYTSAAVERLACASRVRLSCMPAACRCSLQPESQRCLRLSSALAGWWAIPTASRASLPASARYRRASRWRDGAWLRTRGSGCRWDAAHTQQCSLGWEWWQQLRRAWQRLAWHGWAVTYASQRRVHLCSGQPSLPLRACTWPNRRTHCLPATYVAFCRWW